VRPPAELREQTQALLRESGRDMNGFLVACMNAMVSSPESLLEQLREHWPAPKRGRPRKRPKAVEDPAMRTVLTLLEHDLEMTARTVASAVKVSPQKAGSLLRAARGSRQAAGEHPRPDRQLDSGRTREREEP
jgi:hypothetical protein